MKKSSPSADLLRIGRQGADVVALSPVVAASRMLRLATQRPNVAAASLGAMAVEKATTFGRAWSAMASAGMQTQFKFAMALWAPTSFSFSRSSSDGVGSELAAAWVSMVSSAMQPLHARVKRNARKRKRS